MKVKLSITARMKLSELLGEQSGNYAKMKLIRLVREEMSISEEEWKEAECVQLEDGKLKWNPTKDPMKECEIGEVTLLAIQNKLEQLNKTESLKMEQLDLYEKFVELMKNKPETEKKEEEKK